MNNDDLISTLHRLAAVYGWRWYIIRGIVNRQFGTNYTTRELEKLYRQLKDA